MYVHVAVHIHIYIYICMVIYTTICIFCIIRRDWLISSLIPLLCTVGSIPRSIGRLSYLDELDFSSNELTGSIPDTLSGLEHVRELYLSSNMLTGKNFRSDWITVTVM